MSMTINQGRLIMLADWIEQHPKEFNMDYWCGTACCVAGHAFLMFERLDPVRFKAMAGSTNSITVWDTARDWLGLDNSQARALFIPDLPVALHRVPATTAGQALRHFALSGEIDWKRFLPRFAVEDDLEQQPAEEG